MARKSEYASEGVRGHRTYPGADPGAEGAGYGEGTRRVPGRFWGYKTDLPELQELSDQLF